MTQNNPLVTIITQDPNTAQPQSYALPEPTTYSTTTSTIIDGGTSVSGHMLSSIVRSDVVQISLTWNYLDAKTWPEINELFKEGIIKTVLYYDQTKGDWDSREMQVSDRNAGLWRRDSGGGALGWTGCSLQLTEV